MVEPSAVNGVVIGSSPIGTAKEEWQSGLMHLITNQKRRNNLRGFESYFFRLGGLPKWPTGADCKSAGNAFAGSNPASTIKPCLVTLYD